MFFLGKTDMFKTLSELVYFGAHTPFTVSGLGSAFISAPPHHLYGCMKLNSMRAVSPLQFTIYALSMILGFIKCSLATKQSYPASHELHESYPLWVTGQKELCICNHSFCTDWRYPENHCLS